MKKVNLKATMYFAAAVSGLVPTMAHASPQYNLCASGLTGAMPGRANAQAGSTFINTIRDMTDGARDRVVADAIAAGQTPSFMRNLSPVVMNDGRNGGPEVVICVTPDYLSVGNNQDNVRTPMGLPAALRVATRYGFVLPTTAMVNAIFTQADTRLSPEPMPPTGAMTTTSYFEGHDQTVDRQLARRGGTQGDLVAGHKKDLVLSPRLWQTPGRVAIYGWHQSNGRPIQPLSLVHGEYYADYSHGVRLVSAVAYVDGTPTSIYDVLGDANLSRYVSDEGPMPNLRQRIEAIIDVPAPLPSQIGAMLRP